jgi:hypothetical protein
MAASTILIQLKRGLDAARRLLTPSDGEVLVSNDTDHLGGFATVGDGATAGGRYPGAGNAQPGWVTSAYYMTQQSLLAPATAAASANLVLYTPICVPPGGAINMQSIAVNVIGAGGAGSLCRLGVYQSVDGKPAALVYDSGSIDVTTTGLKKPLLLTDRPLKPGWYWLAFTTNGATATYSVLNTLGFQPYIGFSTTAVFRPNLWFQVQAFAALPDPAVPAGNAFGGSPLVFLQAGS